MKKLFSFALVAAMALSLTACAEKHTHTPVEGWELNGKEHWQLCECGETIHPVYYDAEG